MIGGITDDAKSGAKDVQKKAGKSTEVSLRAIYIWIDLPGEKADSIEASIEDQIVQANQSVSNAASSANKAAEDLNKAKNEAIEEAAVKVDNAKQESQAQADLLKTGANAAIDQGLKTAENAVDDQLRAVEKTIDEKMQSASKAVDVKIQEANKYADAKRQELTNVSFKAHWNFRSNFNQTFHSRPSPKVSKKHSQPQWAKPAIFWENWILEVENKQQTNFPCTCLSLKLF